MSGHTHADTYDLGIFDARIIQQAAQTTSCSRHAGVRSVGGIDSQDCFGHDAAGQVGDTDGRLIEREVNPEAETGQGVDGHEFMPPPGGFMFRLQVQHHVAFQQLIDDVGDGGPRRFHAPRQLSPMYGPFVQQQLKYLAGVVRPEALQGTPATLHSLLPSNHLPALRPFRAKARTGARAGVDLPKRSLPQ